jgi:hypothetical protein
MLVFIDESYSQDAEGRTCHALAGFGIPEARYRSLLASLHKIKERHFSSADSMTSLEIAELRKSKIACSGEPRDAELKATKLLTRKAAEYHLKTGKAQSILLVEELLDNVFSLNGVVFGVLSHPDKIADIQNPATLLPIQYQVLLERVDLWLRESHADDHAILIFDSIDLQTSRLLNRCVGDFLFRHVGGQRMLNVVPTPFWVDSSSTPGSQVADIIAHVLMNSMFSSADRKPLESAWRRVAQMEFRGRDGRTRGIRRLKEKQQTGA